MRKIIALFIGLALVPGVTAQSAGSISGEWLITRDAYGNPLYQRMTLTVQDGKVSGLFDGDKLDGTLTGNALHFLSRDEDNDTSEFTGVFNGMTITGKVVETDASDLREKSENEMTATRAPERPAGSPKRHDFTPTAFYRQFSAANEPALKIAPEGPMSTGRNECSAETLKQVLFTSRRHGPGTPSSCTLIELDSIETTQSVTMPLWGALLTPTCP